MLRIIVILAVLGSSTTLAAPIKVYIIAGQSNAVGGGSSATLEPTLAAPQDGLYQYALQRAVYQESDDWGQLRPLNTFGAELSFGQAMERRLGEPIAIIKTAANGTQLAGHWLPSVNNLYPWMIDKVTSSLSQLQDLGFEPTVSGFIWIQHEGDAGLLTLAQTYDDNLLTFASAVRTDLGAPAMPFLINRAHTGLARNYVDELRQSQVNAIAADPFMRMFDADDLALKSDEVHFTEAMHLEVGRRFADLLLPSADFTNDGAVSGADLAAWRGSFGSDRIGDGNADGLADGADFLLWQRQISAAVGVASVPEPGGASLVFGGWIMCACLRRRSRSAGV